MNDDLKKAGIKAAGMFLDTMPEDIKKKWKSQSLHMKLAFFFCWCSEMQTMVENEQHGRLN